MDINKIDRIQSVSPLMKFEANNRITKTNPVVTQSKDQLELSTNAVSFAAVLKDAFHAIENRTPQEIERFEAVSKQVQSGSYEVDSRKLADKILDGVRFDQEV